MAPEDTRRKRHRKHHSKSTKRKDEAEEEEQPKAANEGPVRPQTVDELREARLAYLAQSPEERKMKFISTDSPPKAKTRPRRTTAESSISKPESRRKRSHSNRVRKKSHTDSEDDYVYGRTEPIAEEAERTAPSRAPTTRKAETPRRSQTRRTSSKRLIIEEQEGTSKRKAEHVRRRNSFGIDERDTPERYARDKSCCNVC